MTPTIPELMAEIQALEPDTPEYHEATGFLFIVMAKQQWVIAEELRQAQIKREKAKERAARRKAK